MKRSEAKKYLPIDKDALDEALVEQARLYEEVAEGFAEAEAVRDLLALELEERTAELDRVLRQEAVDNDEKITEGAIKAQILGDASVARLTRELLDKKKEAKLWRALERAFEQRAGDVRKLVDLHLRSVFGYSQESVSVSQSKGALAEGHRAAATALRKARKEAGR